MKRQAGKAAKSKGGRTIRITALDNIFSRYIRGRDGWTCQRCGKAVAFGSVGLHNAHYIGRANKRVRYDEENCLALCWGCHVFMDTHKGTAFRDFMIARLGEERYGALVQRSNELAKRSPDELMALRHRYYDLVAEQMGRTPPKNKSRKPGGAAAIEET